MRSPSPFTPPYLLIRALHPRCDSAQDATLADYRIRYLLNYAPLPMCNPFCESDHPLLGGNASDSLVCSVRSERSGQWRIQRMGPIASRGGNDWHSLRHSNIFDLEPILAAA
eukprot:5487270-Prymnesium_polylepis.1